MLLTSLSRYWRCTSLRLARLSHASHLVVWIALVDEFALFFSSVVGSLAERLRELHEGGYGVGSQECDLESVDRAPGRGVTAAG